MDTQKAEALLDILAKEPMADLSEDDIARLMAGEWVMVQSKIMPASEVYRSGPTSQTATSETG